MSAPYMPLFVSDYLADTAHLSAVEHGAYLLLIMNYWQRGKALPADDRKLSRIARLSDADWLDIRDNIAEFFTEAEGEWSHARIEEEIRVAGEKSAKAKASARASVEARKASAERSLNDRSTDAELLGEDREEKKITLPETNSSTANVRAIGKPIRPAGDETFNRFWNAYPHRGQAADPKAPARAKFDRAVRSGVNPEEIIAAASRYAEIERAAGRAGTEKVAQAVTWLNQSRWQDYAETAPSTPASESFFAPIHSDEWVAWQAFSPAPLKPIETQRGGLGRYFPSRWPPTREGAAA